MKRMISLILIPVMLLGMLAGCGGKREPAPEYTFPDAEYAVNASDMAVVGDKLYYISGGKVYETASDTPVFEDFPAEFLASDGASLAVYGGGRVSYQVNVYEIPAADVSSLVLADGTFCWSCMEGTVPKLGFYNTNTGDSITVTPISGAECRIIPVQDSRIVIQCYEMSGETTLYDFDVETMKPGSFIFTDYLTVCGFSREENALLYTKATASSRVVKLNPETGEQMQMTACPQIQQGTKKLLFSGNSAVILTENGTIHTVGNYAFPVEDDSTVTVITNGLTDFFGKEKLEPISGPLMEQFGIELVVEAQSNTDKLKQKQLAGDDDYDLYFTNGFDLVLDYPVYEPLNNYDCITEQFDGMYEEVRQACTFHGSIFGAPVRLDVSGNVVSYNKEAFDSLGIPMPDKNWTVDDFYDLAVLAREKGAYISNFDPLWSRRYISRHYLARYGDAYETHTLLDDGTALKNALRIQKKLLDENLLSDSDADGDVPVLFYMDDHTSDFAAGENDVWYAPGFDLTMMDNTTTAFLQMNHNSLHKENAALVIAEFMKPEYADSPFIGWVFHKEFGEELRSRSEKAEENFALYLDILSRAVPHYSYKEFNMFTAEQEEKYYNDEQDLEYTAEQIYSRARMLFDE